MHIQFGAHTYTTTQIHKTHINDCNPVINYQQIALRRARSTVTVQIYSHKISGSIAISYLRTDRIRAPCLRIQVRQSNWASEKPSVNRSRLLPWEFLTARLNQCERRTRGLDLPPSGLAWPSTTTSLSGCIRFIEAMSPLPQAWDLINVTQLSSKIIMGIMQKSTFCLRDTMWTGRKISSISSHLSWTWGSNANCSDKILKAVSIHLILNEWNHNRPKSIKQMCKK